MSAPLTAPLSRASLLAALLALGGCDSVGPNFSPPDPQLPRASFRGPPAPGQPAPAPTPAQARVEEKLDSWWLSFRDPTLAALAERAADENLDVAEASARIAQARAQRGVAASAALPGINGDASYQRELYSKNGVLSLAGPDLSAPPISVWQTGFDASWELDLWGRVRRQVEAASADVAAAEERRRDVLVSTQAEIARNYAALRGAQRRVGILEANLKSAEESLELTRTRAAKGLVSDLDVQNAAALVSGVKAQIPAARNEIDADANALALLLGQPPGALAAQVRKPSRLRAPPVPALGVPGELARRRPDIRAAEADLHAATADIGVAVADFYPSVKLNGTVALNALDAAKLWRGSSLQYQFGPTVSLPIFEGGRLKSTLELREARQQETAIAWRKSVLNAWREVVDALNAYDAERRRGVELAAQVDHARQALAISRTRYEGGVADFIRVLDAQRTMLEAMVEQERSDTSLCVDAIALYKALGGGWRGRFPPAPPGPEPSPVEAALAPL